MERKIFACSGAQVPLRLISLALQLCTNEEQAKSDGSKIFVCQKNLTPVENQFGQGGDPVFCSLDLASSLKVADGQVTKAAVEQVVEARAIVREVALSILQIFFQCKLFKGEVKSFFFIPPLLNVSYLLLGSL